MFRIPRLHRAALASAFAGVLLSNPAGAAPGPQMVRLQPVRDIGSGALRPRLACFGALPPTVILDVSGEPLSLWNRVVPLLTERSRVCIWNHGAAISPAQDAARLQQALKAAGEAPPYLRAAHGRGSANLAAFTRQYPQQVLGLLLVDGQPFPANTALDPMLPLAIVTSTQQDDARWQDTQARLAAATTLTTQLLATGPQGSLPMFSPDVVATGLDWLLRFARTPSVEVDDVAAP